MRGERLARPTTSATEDVFASSIGTAGFDHPEGVIDQERKSWRTVRSQAVKGIDGWFSEDEGRWYARFARALRGGVFVEVGSWKGRSTSFIGATCNANGTRLVCVDHWRGSRDVLAGRYAAALAIEDVERTFRENMTALGIAVEVLAASSTEAAARFEPGSVDRVFLDASHDHASVAEDLRVWSERLRQGGILAGHDYADKHPEVRAAVDEHARASGLVVRRGPRSIYWLETPPSGGLDGEA